MVLASLPVGPNAAPHMMMAVVAVAVVVIATPSMASMVGRRW